MPLLLPRIELNASLLSKLFQALSNLAAVKNWTRAQRAMNTVVMMELKMWNLAMKAIVRTGLSDGYMEGVSTEVKEVRIALGTEMVNILKAATKLTSRKRSMMAHQDQG